jgi:hypothetical protein
VAYPEIDPGESKLTSIRPKHFWFAPAKPWDEDYSVTISSQEGTFVERILVKGFFATAGPDDHGHTPVARAEAEARHGDFPSLPERLGKVEFAVRVTEFGDSKPLFTCRDQAFEYRPEWYMDEVRPCSFFSSTIPSFEGSLDPKPFGLNFPSGFIDMAPPLPVTFDSHPEDERDTRRLSEWQKLQMKQLLTRYPHHKVMILAGPGKSTWRFAKDFQEVFSTSEWQVKGPVPEPHEEQWATDVQISVSGQYFGHAPQEVSDISEMFRLTGIKARPGSITDLNIKPGVVVIWVGVKSPDGDKPGYHPPVTSPDLKKLLAHF